MATLLVFLALITLWAYHASSTPLPNTANNLAIDGVYICSGPDWTGRCTWYRASIGTDGETRAACDPLPEVPWVSFGPDKAVTCRLYTNAECPNDPKSSKDIGAPGSAKLAGAANEAGGGGRGLAYKAYRCWGQG